MPHLSVEPVKHCGKQLTVREFSTTADKAPAYPMHLPPSSRYGQGTMNGTVRWSQILGKHMFIRRGGIGVT